MSAERGSLTFRFVVHSAYVFVCRWITDRPRGLTGETVGVGDLRDYLITSYARRQAKSKPVTGTITKKDSGLRRGPGTSHKLCSKVRSPPGRLMAVVAFGH
jgi:hypothetical protein